MPTYTILEFQGHRLVSSEQLKAATVVAAIDACSARDPANRLELWRNGKLAAKLGPAIGRHAEHMAEAPRKASPSNPTPR